RFEKYEQMKKHYEKNLKELRLNVSTSIPHELRTPLNSILGFTQILRSSHKDLSSSDIEMMYDNIMDAGKRLLRLIVNYSYYTNLLNINAANSNKEESVEHPAGMIRDQAMQIADKYSRINDLEFYLDDIPVRISENMLLKTAEELTDNACKFSYSDTPIRINGHRTDNSYRLSFSNLGRGMKPDQVDNIGAFMQFDRRKFEQQGSGLGLAIVKKIAEISGGDFDIDSTPGKGTSISIELPIAE
ncbi:MAG: sensor histidine kinase, partial [Candidatus Kapaibacterium sp.]